MNNKIIWAAVAGVSGLLFAAGIVPAIAFGALVFSSILALTT